MQNVYIIIGDGYASFASDNVITASALMEKLASSNRWEGDEKFVMGLGMGRTEVKILSSALKSHGLSDIELPLAPATLKLTHKHHENNVLISEPRHIAPRQYAMQFQFDQTNDRLCDHVTGQHVSAMLLMEAARQAAIAALELDYGDAFGGSGIVVERFTSTFNSYAFPLPTSMVARIEEGPATEKNIVVACVVTFQQAGQAVCEMKLEGGIYARTYLAKAEARQAQRAITTLRELHEAATEEEGIHG